MAAQTPIWIGTKEIIETPDSPKLGRNATQFRVFRSYEGPYEQCDGSRPVKGNAFSDLPPACLIVDVQVIKKPGGIGRIEVTAETQGPSETDPNAPTYEVEWVEVDKALEECPIYNDGVDYGVTPGAFPLTLGDRCAVQRWQEEDDFNLRHQYKFKMQQDSTSSASPPAGYTGTKVTMASGVEYWVYTLTANAQNLAKKLLRGQTSYRTRSPVIRSSTETFTLPTANPCDKIEDPPSAATPPEGYVYVRSAQRASKTGRYGKWRQEQEWEGAEEVDTDIFPHA